MCLGNTVRIIFSNILEIDKIIVIAQVEQALIILTNNLGMLSMLNPNSIIELFAEAIWVKKVKSIWEEIWKNHQLKKQFFDKNNNKHE